MFKEIKSEDELFEYWDTVSKEYWYKTGLDNSFAKVNPDDYEEFDLGKYPNGMVPLHEYIWDWININDAWWYLDNGDVIFMMYEE